jgi:hypothetical protein
VAATLVVILSNYLLVWLRLQDYHAPWNPVLDSLALGAALAAAAGVDAWIESWWKILLEV